MSPAEGLNFCASVFFKESRDNGADFFRDLLPYCDQRPSSPTPRIVREWREDNQTDTAILTDDGVILSRAFLRKLYEDGDAAVPVLEVFDEWLAGQRERGNRPS